MMTSTINLQFELASPPHFFDSVQIFHAEHEVEDLQIYFLLEFLLPFQKIVGVNKHALFRISALTDTQNANKGSYILCS